MMNLPQAIDFIFIIATNLLVELGISEAFGRIADTSTLERMAQKSGVNLVQTHGLGVGVGSTWEITARIRHRKTTFLLSIVDFQNPDFLEVSVSSGQLDGHVRLDFMAKKHDLTQVRAEVSANPKTLSTRLFLHSLKLTKHRQKNRLKRGLRKLYRHLETTDIVKG